MFVRCDKMFDNFDNLGKILFIKNDVFEDLNENEINHSLDHFGKRPCLIISELDKMYLLPCKQNLILNILITIFLLKITGIYIMT